MTNWRLIRDQLVTRCGGYCESCGLVMQEHWWAAHHRLRRAQGGTNDLSNLVALHHECHNLNTPSVHSHPADAYRRGLLVHSGLDPTRVPLQRPDGSWALLGPSYTPVPPPEGESDG